MRLLIISGEEQYRELVGNYSGNDLKVTRLDELPSGIIAGSYDAVVDLLFNNDKQRINVLKLIEPALIIVNSVSVILDDIDNDFIRINGWSTFLSGPVIEASYKKEDIKHNAVELFSLLNKEIKWLPDEPGFVSARVISMIINEAFHALNEQLSTREEIDTAMKLGTGYPYGPFEWAEKIGLHHVQDLLNKLSAKDSKYKPATMSV